MKQRKLSMDAFIWRALLDKDAANRALLTKAEEPGRHQCRRCLEWIADGEEPDGCRDPGCPEI
jgi:hypothetical protein